MDLSRAAGAPGAQAMFIVDVSTIPRSTPAPSRVAAD